MIILDTFSLSIPTLLHFSRVRKPVLDNYAQFQINFQTPGQLPNTSRYPQNPQNASEILRHEYEVVKHSAQAEANVQNPAWLPVE